MVKRLRKAFPLKGRAYLKEKTLNEGNKDSENEEDLDLENAIKGFKKKRKQYEINLPNINLDRLVNKAFFLRLSLEYSILFFITVFLQPLKKYVTSEMLV